MAMEMTNGRALKTLTMSLVSTQRQPPGDVQQKNLIWHIVNIRICYSPAGISVDWSVSASGSGHWGAKGRCHRGVIQNQFHEKTIKMSTPGRKTMVVESTARALFKSRTSAFILLDGWNSKDKGLLVLQKVYYTGSPANIKTIKKSQFIIYIKHCVLAPQLNNNAIFINVTN